MAELSLGGNVLLSSVNRLHWDVVPNSKWKCSQKGNHVFGQPVVSYIDLSVSGSRAQYPAPLGNGNMSVNLFPMDIRTFNVTYV